MALLRHFHKLEFDKISILNEQPRQLGAGMLILIYISELRNSKQIKTRRQRLA